MVLDIGVSILVNRSPKLSDLGSVRISRGSVLGAVRVRRESGLSSKSSIEEDETVRSADMISKGNKHNNPDKYRSGKNKDRTECQANKNFQTCYPNENERECTHIAIHQKWV